MAEELKELSKKGKLKMHSTLLAKKILEHAVLINEKLNYKKKEFVKPKKILFIQLYGLGDYLMSTPSIHAIKKLFPKAKTNILTKNFVQGITKYNPDISETLFFDDFNETTRKLKAKKFDLVVCLNKSVESSLIASKLNCQRIGYLYDFKVRSNGFPIKETTDSKKLPWVDFYLQIPISLGAKNCEKNYVLKIPQKIESKINKFLKSKKINDFIVFNVGTRPGAEVKAWPTENWIELANKVIEKLNKKIVFIGDEKDSVEIKKIVQKIDNKKMVFDLTRKSIIESSAIIEKSKLLVSIDSGPMHLGFAVKTKVLGLFGLTNPLQIFQFRQGNTAIASKAKGSGVYLRGLLLDASKYQGMKVIKVAEVYNEIKKALK